jgi:hypothetical protein
MKGQSWKRTLADRFVTYRRELDLFAVDGDRHHRPFLRMRGPGNQDQHMQHQKPLDSSSGHRR